MIYPLAICGVCILTSIVGAYFVKLGADNSIMGALYKGLIVTGLLSIVGLAIATTLVRRLGRDRRRRRQDRSPASNLFICGIVGLIITGADRRHHRILHRHRQAPGGVDRAGLRHRPRHQRHPGPRGVAGIDGAAGDRHRHRHHRHLSARRPLRHGDRGDDDARPRRHDRRARRLRPRHRQRRRHRRNGGPAEGSAPLHRRARRGRQHHQGGDQGLRHRLGGPRRAGAVRRLFERPHLLLVEPRQVPLFQGRPRLVRPVEPLCRRRPDLRRPDPLPVRRHRHDRGRPRRRLGRRRGAPPVQGNARHHAGHAAARLRAARSTC